MKNKITDSLNSRYKDQSVSSFLLKASYMDPRYKCLHNVATEGASFATRQAVRDMCIAVVDHQSTNHICKTAYRPRLSQCRVCSLFALHFSCCQNRTPSRVCCIHNYRVTTCRWKENEA